MIIYKDKGGVMLNDYFPKAEESTEINRISGTHTSSLQLANLVFNKYHMNTPVYREMVRLLKQDERWPLYRFTKCLSRALSL